MITTNYKGNRFDSIDQARGVIMILMALDHAVFFVLQQHPLEYWGRVLPEYTTLLPRITRLTAHFCAPGFYLLMGIGLVLFTESREKCSWSDKRIRGSLMLRGVILILLQLTIVNLAWYLGSQGMTTIFGKEGPAGVGGQVWISLDVFYGLGISMIVLALFIKTSRSVLLFLSFASYVGATMLFPSMREVDVAFSPWLRMLLIPGQSESLLVNYPLLPWASLAFFGMWIGKGLVQNKQKMFPQIAVLGFAFLVGFIGVRFIELMGQENLGDFFALTKYPPSVAYVLLTLGGNLLMIWLFSLKHLQANQKHFLIVFGRNAFIFYVTHLYIYAILGLITTNEMPFYTVYVFWIIGLIPLYAICKLYMQFKQSKSVDSFWRLI